MMALNSNEISKVEFGFKEALKIKALPLILSLIVFWGRVL